MTSVWLKDPAHNAPMAKAIWDKHYDNVSAIYYRDGANYHRVGVEDGFPALITAYDYLLSTEGSTGSDIAILLRENARNSGLPRMLGRHGGADWGSQQVTLMFSGPGVQVGTSDVPARLVDIAPTIERFMGITPNARDGIVLADAFQTPHPTDVRPHKVATATFAPMVAAQQQRAASVPVPTHPDAFGHESTVWASSVSSGPGSVVGPWPSRTSCTSSPIICCASVRAWCPSDVMA